MKPKIKLCLFLLALIPACSHPLEIQGQGDIVCQRSTRNCLLDEQPCSNLVINEYQESYSSNTKAGHYFAHGKGCSRNLYANCDFDIKAAVVRQFLATAQPAVKALFEPCANIGNCASSDNIILHGGTFTTLDSANPTATALAYDQSGRILAVGNLTEVTAIAGQSATSINLNGAHVVPGFHDVHLHAVEAGINESRCLLTEFGTQVTYRREIAACASAQTANSWFIAAGVSMPDLLGAVDYPAGLLDELIPNKPALILDNLGHGAWANNAALQSVGYDVLAGNPAGGMIDRDEHGFVTGIVYENAQQQLRNAALPATASNQQINLQALLNSLQTLAANGITSVSDAGGYWTRGHHLAWIQAEENQQLSVRAGNALYLYPEREKEQQIKDLIALKRSGNDKLARFDHIKIYVDGILSQSTAALETAYAFDQLITEAGSTGFEYFKQSDLNDYAARLDAAGFSLHFHAVGDRAVNLAINAIEHAQQANGATGNQYRITHMYLISSTDITRMKNLGIIADLQLTASSIQSSYVSYLRSLIGNRVDNLIPAAALLNAGVEVTISSDWDADELSPLSKIENIATRSANGIANVETILRLMTLNSAKALNQDSITGSLEVGKFADLAILDRNITTVPVGKIGNTKVLATLLAGEAVFDAQGLFD